MIILLAMLLSIFVIGEIMRFLGNATPLYMKPKRFLFMFNGNSLLGDASLYPIQNNYSYANVNNFCVDIGDENNGEE